MFGKLYTKLFAIGIQFDMKSSMKNTPLHKKLHQLHEHEIDGIKPDISIQVEAMCGGFNSRVLEVRNFMLSITSDKIATDMLSRKGEAALIDVLDSVQEHIEKNRSSFEDFHADCKQLIAAGCLIGAWAKSCLKNADGATRDAVKNFEIDRKKIMDYFYDSLPSSVRLGKAPIFGGVDSKNVGNYLSSLLS